MTGAEFVAAMISAEIPSMPAVNYPVSYTPLTLPTIYPVYVSGVAVSLQQKQ